jgi:hypothetical protein
MMLNRNLRRIILALACLMATTGCDSSIVRTPESFSPPYIAPRQSQLEEVASKAEVPTEQCSNDARFVEDLTVPDGEIVQPGIVLNKRWLVTNAGTCNWGPGYMFVRTDQGTFPAPDRLALYPARAGTDAPWSVTMQAPVEEGEYLASWQAQSPEGVFFGDVVFILFNVEMEEN